MTADYSLSTIASRTLSRADDRGMRFYELVRPLIFRMQPETAHHVTLAFLRMGGAVAPARGLLNAAFRPTAAVRTVQAFGLTFPNAIGLAAGYRLHAVMTLTQMLDHWTLTGRVPAEQIAATRAFLNR